MQKQKVKAVEKVKTKLRVGDTVFVRTGGDKGATGEILEISRVRNAAKVKNVKMLTKHIRGRQGADPSQTIPGKIEKREGWVALSNLGIYNAATGKAERITNKEVDGKKQRVFVSDGKAVDIS